MKPEEDMANPIPTSREVHEEPPTSIAFKGRMPIQIELPELPETAEEIQEMAEEIVFRIRSNAGLPHIAAADADVIARQIESKLTEIVAAHRLNQAVLDATAAAFLPVRKAMKGLGRIHKGREHAG